MTVTRSRIRTHALIAAATMLLPAAAPARGGSPPPATDRANIVVVMTDDQTVEQMRVLSATRQLIGEQGAEFRNSLVSFPLCCPSRATFLTGQYAHNHLVLENDPPTGGYGRLDHSNTLPAWLQKAGYRTVHVGKFLNDYGLDDPHEVPPGWTEWYGSIDPSTYWMWGYTLNENGTLRTYGDFDVEDVENYQTDVYRDLAVDAIRRAADGDEPLFLNVWFLTPHEEVIHIASRLGPRSALRHRGTFDDEPLPDPPSFNEEDMTDKPLYMQVKPVMDDEMIAGILSRYRHELEALLAVDEAVEAIVDALADEGMLDDTYVIFVSDNGYMHGEHRTPTEKIVPYEESARVPMLMRGPGIAAGTLVDELVVNVDLAPTIVGLAGATAGVPPDGRSLMPYISDTSLRSTRPVLLEAYFPVGSAVRFFTDQIQAGGGPGGGGGGGGGGIQAPLSQAVMSYQGIRTDRYAYIEYTTGEHELYDLFTDPYQMESKHLDPRYLRTQIALAEHLTHLRFCAGAECRRETGPIPDPS